MNKQKLTVLGSTGSIGTQTLDIVRQQRDKFEIVALSANSNSELLAAQVREFKPSFALICDEKSYRQLEKEHFPDTEFLYGTENLAELAALPECNTVLNALVGFAGFESTLAAINAGKKVALANKESLVVGGELIMKALEQNNGSLVPVDSEHSAMLQCLAGEDVADIEKIIITASGGPFRKSGLEQMKSITVEQALNHPNWNMGAKITVDSSTMMNKGLEIIEAHWLFNIPVNKIQPVIHPQSIIHSIVTFVDGSSKAQLGLPDMKVPINYALSYPERIKFETPRINWDEIHELIFEPVDYNRFPCVKLAMDSLEMGNLAPAVLNAANEVAVEKFLNREISYIQIAEIVEKSLHHIKTYQQPDVQAILEIDKETRDFASSLIK